MITKDDFTKALKDFGGSESQKILQDPQAYQATFDLLITVAKDSSIFQKKLSIANTAAGVANMAVGHSSADRRTKNAVRAGSFALSQFQQTANLASVTRLSPGAAMVAVSATVVNKTGIIVSFAGGDKKKAQCIGAVMELSASAVMTAVSAPTGVLLVLSVASLAASSVNAYNSCF
ncbi:hypothetical protein GFK91_19670 [Roseibium aggregatum]|uniref:hypothetical protein n=1 Tax=Roseibium aggregatum TaxID=187304 RepID=UPI001E65A165|nr:hypothetical protein [Roseibium aggregatum]UES57644.1 hypothetical protein GFK91_19670 [Roseibium aggregatum]